MPRCDWHNLTYERPDCPKCALETWKAQRNGGRMIALIVWPFWLAGLILGTIIGAFLSSFKEFLALWDDSWKYIRAEKPK